ncbi:MAG TPA: HIT family protein [Candidatus Paceibacterota bacterium]|nr:HIT family protein [Candidatus Paceibacterota bacterium]
MDECPFCEIIQKNTDRKLLEGEYVFATLSNPRLMPGHVLVIPKRHVSKIGDLNEDELKELMQFAIKLQNKILEKVSTGCDIVQNYRPHQKADNYYRVDHLHLHVRPRHANDRLYTEVRPHYHKVFEDLSKEESDEFKKIIFNL